MIGWIKEHQERLNKDIFHDLQLHVGGNGIRSLKKMVAKGKDHEYTYHIVVVPNNAQGIQGIPYEQLRGRLFESYMLWGYISPEVVGYTKSTIRKHFDASGVTQEG